MFKNKSTKFIIFEIIIMMIGVIGITLAVSYVMNSVNINVDTANLAIDYTGSLTLPSVNLVPILDSEVESNTENVMRINFSVKGASTNPNIPIIYDVILSDLVVDSALKSEYVKWELEKNGTVISSGSLDPWFDSIRDGKFWLTEIQQDLVRSSGTADNYEFRLWISEACTGDITTCTEDMDQSDMLNKSISGKIEVVLYTKGKEALIRHPGIELPLDLPSVNLIPIGDTEVESNNNNVMRVNFVVNGDNSNSVYDIMLSNLQIDEGLILRSQYLKWELEKNGEVISTGTLDPRFDDSILDGNLYLTEIQQDSPGKTSDVYEFRLWISEACPDSSNCPSYLNQSHMLNKNLSGKIEVIASNDEKRELIRNGIEVSYGDVNGDSHRDTGDSTFLLQYISEMVTFNYQQMLNADVNEDGIIDNKDSTIILRVLAGTINDLPYHGEL